MKNRRQLILDYLATRGSATPTEIGRALHMPSANVRHHLTVLLEQGAIQASGEIHTENRGRPARLYQLVSQARQHNLDRLASLLLDELLIREEDSRPSLDRVAHRLAGEPLPDPRASLARRLVQSVIRLNALHYQARWEARAVSPRLILGHCPFAAIIESHSELCQVDAAMLKTWLTAPVTQVEKLVPDRRGGRHCAFVISSELSHLSAP